MWSRGGWRSLFVARPYVTFDEMNVGLLAQGTVDDSSPRAYRSILAREEWAGTANAPVETDNIIY